jgi:hypothetical protein
MKAPHDITRYDIIRDEHDVPCDHSMCEVFHKRLDPDHTITRRYWLIIDTETGWRAFDGDTYDTKTEATKWLIRKTDDLLRLAAAAR